MLCFDFPFLPSPTNPTQGRPVRRNKSVNQVENLRIAPSSFISLSILVFFALHKELHLAVLSDFSCLRAATVAFHFIRISDLLGHSGAEDLGTEEAALGALDDLLVDAHGRVVHDDGAGLIVDLGVDAGVADEVNNPLLTLVLAKAEAGGEVPVGRRLVVVRNMVVP